MSKPNVRSFRFSDDVMSTIENFKGSNLSEKFENLVKHCFFAVPHQEKRLKELEKEISEKYARLRSIKEYERNMDMLIGNLEDIRYKIKNAGDCADLVCDKLMKESE